MPILENDPWRTQYFEGVPCPDDVVIPTDDADAYRLYPQHRWIYNKLLIAETQGLECGPHGMIPPRFPVFSKPIYNMRGMGTGTKIIESLEDYGREQAPGNMWMPLLTGEHVSSDVAVVGGHAQWWRHAIGKALPEGMFDYWTVLAEARPKIEDYCGQWLGANLKGYTGIVNFETIGGQIIEAHLRMSDQWVDLYGPGWVESVIDLYAHGSWSYGDTARRTGYSVVLFGGHGPRYKKVDPAVIAELRRHAEVSSIQITFHENKLPKAHAMPPGGFRLAIVNCWDLDVGLAVREQLALHFWSVQKLRPRRAPRGARLTTTG